MSIGAKQLAEIKAAVAASGECFAALARGGGGGSADR